MTSGHISSGLDLTYGPSTISMQQPSEGELDLLFEAMYDDYIGGQPSATARTVPPTQEHQVRQTSTVSTTIADTAPIPTNSSSLATNILISSQDEVISKVVYAMCKKCLISVNHDKCLCKNVNGKNSCGKNKKAKVSVKEIQMKYQPKITKSKKVEYHKSLAIPKPKKSRLLLRWSPTGRLFNQEGKLVDSNESKSKYECSNGDNACTSNVLEPKIKRFPNSTSLLDRNDLVVGLPKFKYHKEHLCLPVNDYSRYTWVHFLRSKDEAPEVIIMFLKRITVLLQSLVIIIRTDNGTEFKNQVLKEYFDTVGISHQMSSVRTPQQNGVVERRNWTLVEAARTMLIFSRAPLFLWAEAITTACFTQNRSIIHRRFNKTPYELINGRKPDISFLYVFGALCYPKNDREDIGKLGVKGDIGFFIGLKPGLQSMTSGHISSGLDLTYAPSTITMQQSSEGKLDLLFEAMYDDYIGGQPSATARTVPPAQDPQVRQLSTTSTTIADTAPIPTNSSSHATNIPIASQDVDERNSNAMVDGNTFVNPFANSSTSAVASSSHQNSKYVLEILNKYGMESCDPIGTSMVIKDKLDLDQNGTLVDATKYRSMIGALMYLTSSRPDIVHATCLCAWYQAKPTEKHIKEVKRIFCYLWGTVNTGLWYTKDSGFELTGFSDADYTGCKDTFKSIFGGAQFLAIAISCNPVQHSRTKHIVVWYHFIKEHVEKGTIELYFIKTDYQLADIFTKALSTDHFNYLVRRLEDDGVTTSLQLSRNSRPPMLDHQDKYMMKAQVHVLKSSAISDVQPLPQRKHYCQIYQVVKHILRGRLLASFQDREHVGGDTRSQGGMKDNDLKIKIQDHNMHMIYQRISQEQGSKFQERFI
uniref:Integrase catalytic domain-containing protein n=1 Tax=Tanacetum cinerariifolium TaxID=118510 RepID=A0A6L2NZI1_TANCI|nr:hypothetical protein [Tanacetum cinerariifolium]